MEHFKEVLELEASAIQRAAMLVDPKQLASCVEAILACKGNVVVTGMGKSGHIGTKLSATLASTGTPSVFVHPAEAIHGDLGMIKSNDFVVAISNSGETSEIVRLLPFFQTNPNQVLALAGSADSTLANKSDFFLDCSVEREACALNLAPTTSTTTTMAIGDALAVCLMRARGIDEKDFARFHPGGSLGRRLLGKVEDVMQKGPLPQVDKNASALDVLLTVSNSRLGMTTVGLDGALGVISDGDLRRASVEFQEDFLGVKASQIASKNPTTIDKSAKIVDAERIMVEKKISWLIVTEHQKPVGIVQIYDL